MISRMGKSNRSLRCRLEDKDGLLNIEYATADDNPSGSKTPDGKIVVSRRKVVIAVIDPRNVPFNSKTAICLLIESSTLERRTTCRRAAKFVYPPGKGNLEVTYNSPEA